MSDETLVQDSVRTEPKEPRALPDFANLFDSNPEYMRDPFKYFAAAARHGSIVREPHFGIYLATRYTDILDIERRHEDFSATVSSIGPYAVGKMPERPASGCPFGKADLAKELDAWLETTPLNLTPVLTADPPYHTEVRNVINRLFTPGRKEELTPRLYSFADELIDVFAERGETEWVATYAAPYTYFTMNDVMDFPRADEDAQRKRFLSLKHMPRMQRNVDGTRPRDEQDLDNPLAVSHERMCQYLAERRADPGGDVLSAIATARSASGALPDIDVIARIAAVMYGAGQGTTKDLIGNGMRILATDPQLQSRLREHPEEIENFVAEVLRFDPPVHGLFRYCVRDTQVNGVDIPAGAVIWMIYAEANRDPNIFANPDVFDHTRGDAFKAISFGHGRHFCPGQPLARLEAQISFEVALRRLNNIRLKDPQGEIPYHEWFVVRGPKELDIVFDSARRWNTHYVQLQ